MRAIRDYQWAAGVQVTLRALWARVSVPVPKPPFKVKKLCIQIRKPQFDPLWVYASVPLLVGQNMGEMEGREGKCIKAWPNLFFFFFNRLQNGFKVIPFSLPPFSHLTSHRETHNARTQCTARSCLATQHNNKTPPQQEKKNTTKKTKQKTPHNKKYTYSPTNTSQLRWLE